MFIDKSTIYISNGKQFCGKTFVLPVLRRSLGKIEQIFFTYITRLLYPKGEILGSLYTHTLSTDKSINQ